MSLGQGTRGKEAGGGLETVIFANGAGGVGEPILFDVEFREGLLDDYRSDGCVNQEHGVGDSSAKAGGDADGGFGEEFLRYCDQLYAGGDDSKCGGFAGGV